MEERRNVYKILVGKLREIRSLERSRRNFETGFKGKVCGDVNWTKF
jgi:hypothetical protein